MVIVKLLQGRAKGDGLKVTELNLRKSAVSCEICGFSAVSRNSLCLGFFLYFKGKDAPSIKNLRGQRTPGGGGGQRGTRLLRRHMPMLILEAAFRCDP